MNTREHDYCPHALDPDNDVCVLDRPADYELPTWQAQPMTLAQRDKLQLLCERFRVAFDPTHYRVNSDAAGGFALPGFAEGWIGGNEQANRTIYVGVEPNGDSHS